MAATRSRRAIPPTSCSFAPRASMTRWRGGRRNAQCSRLDGRWLDRRERDRSLLYLANGDHPDWQALAHPLALPRQSAVAAIGAEQAWSCQGATLAVAAKKMCRRIFYIAIARHLRTVGKWCAACRVPEGTQRVSFRGKDNRPGGGTKVESCQPSSSC